MKELKLTEQQRTDIIDIILNSINTKYSLIQLNEMIKVLQRLPEIDKQTSPAPLKKVTKD